MPKDVIWAVGARYGFGANEIWNMSINEIMFWYEGHVKMYNEETERTNKMFGKKK